MVRGRGCLANYTRVTTVLAVAQPQRQSRPAVVRSIARAGGRTCARPGCPAPARATLDFVYETREVRLDALRADPSPATYDLCESHADRTSPPYGWTLVDDRPEDPTERAPRLDDEQATVAVLAAALHPVAAGDEPEDDLAIDTITAAAAELADAEVEVAIAELHALSSGPGRHAGSDPDRAHGSLVAQPRPVLAVRGSAGPAGHPVASDHPAGADEPAGGPSRDGERGVDPIGAPDRAELW